MSAREEPRREAVVTGVARSVHLLRLRDVIGRVGLARASIYRMVRRGEFPPPVHPTPATSAWVSTEIDDWIAERVNASRAAAAKPEHLGVAVN